MGTTTGFAVAGDILAAMRVPALAVAAVAVTACAGRFEQPRFAADPASVDCQGDDCENPTRVIKYRRDGCPLPSHAQPTTETAPFEMDECPACGLG
jgi:hypothetical protein